ncbi:sensor histidine kinase [Nitrolancea hollandica]|nr:GAF domain-containing sensor histidine kinase [Nitrolancea hollandica]
MRMKAEDDVTKPGKARDHAAPGHRRNDIHPAKGSGSDNTSNARDEEERESLAHYLGERVKELTALHEIARVLQSENAIPEVLGTVVPILQTAWQYPEITAVRVRYGTLEQATANFRPSPWKQVAEFSTVDGRAGFVEISYLEERPEANEGPFLAEERNLINSVTAMLTSYFERKRVEEELRFLAEASRLLAASLDYETTLQSVARIVVPILGDFCFFDVVSPHGTIQRVAGQHANPARQSFFAEACQFIQPIAHHDGHPVANVLATGKPAFVPRIDEGWMQKAAISPEHLRFMHEIHLQSLITVPLIARGRTLGALTLGFTSDSGRHYTHADLNLAEDLAHRAANAIDNARLYREEQELVRSREEFLSIASHELKTPLTILKASAQILSRQVLQSDLDRNRITGCAQRLQVQVDRLETLVADLLDASRLQQGRLELRTEPYDLREIGGEILARFQDAPERTEHHRLTLDAPAPVIGLIDPARLDQVLTNLLSNALKYSPGGGEVRLGIHQCGDQALITVSDQGIGITPAEQTRLFQPFSRGDAVRGISGTGLGLYISRQIVERHGGTITAESQPGTGSTFNVRLPLAARPKRATNRHSHPPS